MTSTARFRLALAGLAALLAPCPAVAFYAESAGRPAAKPLPTYCQMGECFVTTVEAIDPVAFASNAVLFKVESQNWHSNNSNGTGMKRNADSVGYVLCSKKVPAVVTQMGEQEYLVDFLALDDSGSYGHSNETVIAEYFVVCHARAFGDKLFDQGPAFAASLGYRVKARSDQPTIDEPRKVLDYLR